VDLEQRYADNKSVMRCAMGSNNSDKDKAGLEHANMLTNVQRRILNGIYDDFFGSAGSGGAAKGGNASKEGGTDKRGGTAKNSGTAKNGDAVKNASAANNSSADKSGGTVKSGSTANSGVTAKNSGTVKNSGTAKSGADAGGSDRYEAPVFDMQAGYDDVIKSARDALLEARRLIEDDELGLGTGMTSIQDAQNTVADGTQGKGAVAYNGGPQAVTDAAEAPPEPEEDPMEQLDRLIGLNAIKHDVREMADFAKLAMIRKEKGLKAVPVSMHLVFTGNPGTGKTTVARILAKIYKNIGVLSKGQLVEVDRSGLVAGYVGQTALKTQDVIKSALGGVLFIDEAYALSQKDDNFGQEAIDTILKAMEDHRDDFIVIVAGYTKPMEKFINSNPGLKSRFNKYIEFPDYTIEELEKIFYMNCDKYDYKVSEDAKGAIKAMILTRKLNNPVNFANARDVRNMFEDIITNQARRVVKMKDPKPEDICMICLEDLTEDPANDHTDDKKAGQTEDHPEDQAADRAADLANEHKDGMKEDPAENHTDDKKEDHPDGSGR
jgi:DNA polymerase III delta prime subunit